MPGQFRIQSALLILGAVYLLISQVRAQSEIQQSAVHPVPGRIKLQRSLFSTADFRAANPVLPSNEEAASAREMLSTAAQLQASTARQDLVSRVIKYAKNVGAAGLGDGMVGWGAVVTLGSSVIDEVLTRWGESDAQSARATLLRLAGDHASGFRTRLKESYEAFESDGDSSAYYHRESAIYRDLLNAAMLNLPEDVSPNIRSTLNSYRIEAASLLVGRLSGRILHLDQKTDAIEGQVLQNLTDIAQMSRRHGLLQERVKRLSESVETLRRDLQGGRSAGGSPSAHRDLIEGLRKQFDALRSKQSSFANWRDRVNQWRSETETLLKEHGEELVILHNATEALSDRQSVLARKQDRTDEIIFSLAPPGMQRKLLESNDFMSHLPEEQRAELKRETDWNAVRQQVVETCRAAHEIAGSAQVIARNLGAKGEDAQKIDEVVQYVQVAASVGMAFSGEPVAIMNAIAAVTGLLGNAPADPAQERFRAVMKELGAIRMDLAEIKHLISMVLDNQALIYDLAKSSYHQARFEFSIVRSGLESLYDVETTILEHLSSERLGGAHAFRAYLGRVDRGSSEKAWSVNHRAYFNTHLDSAEKRDLRSWMQSVLRLVQHNQAVDPIWRIQTWRSVGDSVYGQFNSDVFRPCLDYGRAAFGSDFARIPMVAYLQTFSHTPVVRAMKDAGEEWRQALSGFGDGDYIDLGRSFEHALHPWAIDTYLRLVLDIVRYRSCVVWTGEHTSSTSPRFIDSTEMLSRPEIPSLDTRSVSRDALSVALQITELCLAQQTLMSGEGILAQVALDFQNIAAAASPGAPQFSDSHVKVLRMLRRNGALARNLMKLVVRNHLLSIGANDDEYSISFKGSPEATSGALVPRWLEKWVERHDGVPSIRLKNQRHDFRLALPSPSEIQEPFERTPWISRLAQLRGELIDLLLEFEFCAPDASVLGIKMVGPQAVRVGALRNLIISR